MRSAHLAVGVVCLWEALEMQQRSSSPGAMQKHLEEPAVQQSIQQQLESIHTGMATTIGKAAELAGVPEAKLRYWESIGLLAPARSNQPSQSPDRGRQRYYSMEQLAQAIVIKELEKDYPLAEVREFIKRDALFIERLIAEPAPEEQEMQEEQPSILQTIGSAEDALFWEFFLPRSLYLSLSLLFEQAFSGNGGIYLPVRGSDGPPESLRVTRAVELPKLGEGLLGWREPNHAFLSAPFKTPPPELSEKYDIIPLTDLLPAGAEVLPIGAHLALEPRFADLLRQLDLSKKGRLEARRVASRLLKFVQDEHPRWREALRAPKSAQLFDSPTLTNPSLGGPLLNRVAEMIVALSGKNKATHQPLWRFCCILLPEDSLPPLMARSLVVRGQSSASPYKVGETKLAPTSFPRGLSILAYQSGLAIYRPYVTQEDPALAWREREAPIGSAMALPIEGEYGKALGVIYIVSAQQDAFSLESQQLLRMLGRITGELVTSARDRALSTTKLADLLEDPEVVDHILKDFRTINTFRSDLRVLFQTAAQEQERPFQYLCLVGIDIDDLRNLALQYGDVAATKNIVEEVGQQITQALHLFAQAKDIRLYRAYVDRFYLLLTDLPPDQTEIAAERLKDALREQYRVYVRRVSPEQLLDRQHKIPLQITTRLGMTGYSYDDLKGLSTVEEREAAIDRLESKLASALAQKGKEGVVVRL